MSHLVVTAISGLLYLLLSADYSIRNIIFSLVIGSLVAIVFRPNQKISSLQQIPSTIWALLRYILILIIDLFKSGVLVARIVASPKLPINPGVITISSDCETELANALSAHAVTLTPGELVIEMDEHGVMYTHVLNVDNAQEYAEQAQSLRKDLLRKIFP
jgi:multicomponent Na+:H+ antiporter subunit E